MLSEKANRLMLSSRARGLLRPALGRGLLRHASVFTPVNSFAAEQRDAEGNRVLYHANQELTCRVMLSAASFNLFYWSYYLATCAYYKDVVVQGLNLGGDPRWGFAGAFGTGLMFYVTQQYSHHAVSK